jgi:predicted nucleic acid-binding protein
VLTLDTSGILAALDSGDPHHRQAVTTLRDDGGPLIVAAGIMAEVAYMIEARLGANVLDAFFADLEQGAFTLDCAESDLPRVRALMARYRDMPLGYADASVVACAERQDGRVLTYDRRHFSVVSREGSIRIVGLDQG